MITSQKPKPWYMIYGGRFSGDQPFFHNTADFPWVELLEDNWQMIRDELEQLLAGQDDRLKPYFNKQMQFPPRHWKTLGFYFWKFKIHKNCCKCPGIDRLLSSIPNLTGGSLSVLEPRATINPHQGDTDAIVRGHLGLTIPGSLPDCGFQVGTEIREWQNGQMLLFCDAHTHTAWNDTDQRRLIFIVDVMRPEFVSQTDAICSHVLASTLLQMLYQEIDWLNRLPGQVQFVLHFLSRGIIRLLLPLQRRFSFLGGG